jgi:Ca2+:H+ antiporter
VQRCQQNKRRANWRHGRKELAMVLHFRYDGIHMWIFITAYIGMVPAANLVGFGGQELARKIPKVLAIILETTLASVTEIILFMGLVSGGNKKVPVIQAAILGSILANLLLCLGAFYLQLWSPRSLTALTGFSFFVGGIFHPQQTFHEAISEVGSNLMLVAGMGLIIPTFYYSSLAGKPTVTLTRLEEEAKHIPHTAAVILLLAFLIYMWFQARSHHSLYQDLLEADEERSHNRSRNLAKAKLTIAECVVALAIALTFVTFMVVYLVQEIEYMVVERGVSDHFMGLILVPLVEKASEHLTAIDEAYNNQMNSALAHVLGASIQTALLNTPLVVIVGWGSGTKMTMNFELFDAVLLILTIIVVGNFLRDGKSDYLEGVLCVFVYVLIAVPAFYYPNPLATQQEIAHLQAELEGGHRGTFKRSMSIGGVCNKLC